MRITFLEARVPLTKKFTASSKEPYPNAYEFKSHTHAVKSLQHFTDLVKTHAALGHCLLKGELQKELNWESRAGSTNPNFNTSWICFDLDGLPSVADTDAFMHRIGLDNVSYLRQFSASYGINGDFTLRAHVFVFAKSAASAAALKIYLKQLNLTLFQSDLSLTKTNVALRWPVDITTCQNDKLIFITPPNCTPATIDQFNGQRIELVQRAVDFFDFESVQLQSAEQLKQLEEQEINLLRAALNLPERKTAKFKLKEFKGELYMPSPDQATVTGQREERGFVYFNLNGGDSWAYFHPSDNPTFIYNFKGEPTYKTSELLPDYWDSVQTAKRQAAKQAHKGKLFLAFRDFRTAEYFNGWYDQTNDELVLNSARSERQLEDFLANYGQPIPDAVPIWNVTYDPNASAIDLASKTLNTFQPSELMKVAAARFKTAKPKPTPLIDRIITHVLGQELFDHFINWLAYCFQYRSAPQTAWILHGVPGTGKGVLINHVLTQLFGPSNVSQKRMEELEDKFNSHLENTLLCCIDEAQISDSLRSQMIMANLKNQITEPVITIRRMRTNAYEVPNRVGFIFSSNKPDPVTIEAGDRRFNVGAYQKDKIQVTSADIKAIGSELTDFAIRLQQYTVDVDRVRVTLLTESKKEMQLASRTSADAVADAVLTGDLSMLWEALPTGDIASLDATTAVRLQPYKKLMHELVKSRRDRLTRDELFTIFNYNVGNVATSPWKFTLYLKHHGVHVAPVRVGTKVVKGVLVAWTNSDEWFQERIEEINAENAPKIKVVAQHAPTFNPAAAMPQ